MVRKAAIEERQDALEQNLEGLEQAFEGLTMEMRTGQAELRGLLERLELRLPRKKKRRRRARSSTVVNDGDEDEDDDSSTNSDETVGESLRPRHRYRGRKVEIPVFEGEEAYSWLVKVERYFKINGVKEEEMLEAVMIALDGRALN